MQGPGPSSTTGPHKSSCWHRSSTSSAAATGAFRGQKGAFVHQLAVMTPVGPAMVPVCITAPPTLSTESSTLTPPFFPPAPPPHLFLLLIIQIHLMSLHLLLLHLFFCHLLLILDFHLLCLLYCISTSSFTFILHLLFLLVVLQLLLHLPLLFHHPQLPSSSCTFLSSSPCVLDVSSSTVSLFLRDDCFLYRPDQDRRLAPRGGHRGLGRRCRSWEEVRRTVRRM